MKDKIKIKGNRIKEVLKQKNMSQQELADKCGISKHHLSMIVNNKKPNLSVPIALKISKALKTNIDDLFII
ncbi:MAG: helix-turn-helix transcriptional regulator [Candidatus Woesearchaeota archaeon]